MMAEKMIGRAVKAGVPFSWVAGDEVYGGNPGLMSWLEGEGIAYGMAVACGEMFAGLAEPRELPVHLLPRPVGVPQRFVFREAVPGVVAQDVRERELLGGVEALGWQPQARHRYVRGQVLGPFDGGILDRHQERVGLD